MFYLSGCLRQVLLYVFVYSILNIGNNQNFYLCRTNQVTSSKLGHISTATNHGESPNESQTEHGLVLFHKDKKPDYSLRKDWVG